MAGLGPTSGRRHGKLTTGGDFLVVLTAPAGAGKTTTLGAAARIWHNAGFEVVGLAPSARAAAELAKATGGSRGNVGEMAAPASPTRAAARPRAGRLDADRAHRAGGG